ncbi:dihydrodipicolinate reductase [Gymnodinialimonas hymeniacidonis]|uniref:dihydrodipicolinate reductase n=1 Tax=Gymnodinialimonas hymeniacidonis TaxID=3126508 RepID=UPI0034C60E12
MTFKTIFTAAVASLCLTAPALADLTRVSDRGTFLSYVQGRELTRIGVSLRVSPDGSIAGRALGRDVTGTWAWEGGMFCRTLDAGDRQFGRNCQVVSVDGNSIRFHADQGTGEIADFRIR